MLKRIVHAMDPTPDALSLLKEDHRKVEALFEQYESADNKRSQGSIAQRICAELDVHTRLEELAFYPAIQREVPEAADEVKEAIVEHSAVKRLIKEIQGMQPSDEMFNAKVTVVMEFVKHHVREEENDLFPMLTESELDLKALRERLIATKQRLQKGEAPAAARTAPRKRKVATAKARRPAAARSGRARSRGNSSGQHASA